LGDVFQPACQVAVAGFCRGIDVVIYGDAADERHGGIAVMSILLIHFPALDGTDEGLSCRCGA